MNEYQVLSIITKSDLTNKGFIVHTNENDPDAFCTKVSKGDVEGYVCFNNEGLLDNFPECYILFAQELCKSFPDIQIISDNQFYEFMHLTSEDPEAKLVQMTDETVGSILAYDPTKRVEMVDPDGNPIKFDFPRVVANSICDIKDTNSLFV